MYQMQMIIAVLVSSMVITSSAELSPIRCNKVQFYHAKLVEVEDWIYRDEGLWSCGLPRRFSELEVWIACGLKSQAHPN